tara:strand:- start:119 stop:517 length:399 start_codon:yes stop_codon:yes gene_type:complete
MADNPNLGGWGREAWNTGSWDTPSTVLVTGVSAAAAVGSVQVDITVPVTGVSAAAVTGTPTASGEAIAEVTGVSAATAVGSVQVDLTVPVTGVEAATAVGRVNIWEQINPGQTAGWDPITYTQAPNWTKIAA